MTFQLSLSWMRIIFLSVGSHTLTCTHTHTHSHTHHMHTHTTLHTQVEELAPCGSLYKYLKDKGTTLNVDHYHTYACQIDNAMKYLESRQMVHCDLATRNILLTHPNYVSWGEREREREWERMSVQEDGERAEKKRGGREGEREGKTATSLYTPLIHTQ